MLWTLILQLAEKTKLSDIHIHSDAPIAYREFGEMIQMDEHVVKESQIKEFLQDVLDDEVFAHFLEHARFLPDKNQCFY